MTGHGTKNTGDTTVIPLHDSRSIVLYHDALVICDQTAEEGLRIAIADISGISRGGRDLTIIRREADPVAVTAMTVADALRLLDALRRQAKPARPPWWKRYRLQRPGW